MQITEATKILKRNYESAPESGKAIAVHLFAVKYADGIKDLPIKKLLERAGVPISYEARINKGIDISRHVVPKY